MMVEQEEKNMQLQLIFQIFLWSVVRSWKLFFYVRISKSGRVSEAPRL